jgi:hypothetical protein
MVSSIRVAGQYPVPPPPRSGKGSRERAELYEKTFCPRLSEVDPERQEKPDQEPPVAGFRLRRERMASAKTSSCG